MFQKKEPHWLWSFVWLPLFLLVQYISDYTDGIEAYFSRGWYPFWSSLLRGLFSRFPFSVGDLAYGLGIAYSLKKIYAYRKEREGLKKSLLFVGRLLGGVYLLFNLSWGFNYYRQPLAQTLALPSFSPDRSSLVQLTQSLVYKTNQLHNQLSSSKEQGVQVPFTAAQILEQTPEGFSKLAKQYPLLAYHKPALKKSLIATPLSYMGYAGYLNPFSLEAQINQKIPLYRLPLVASHEVGHQLGYASERDTNFIGYLAALKHPNPYFKYAATTLALSYCLRDLHRLSPEDYEALRDQIRPGVLQNYQQSTDFWNSYENPLEPYFEKIFNSFLKINKQAAGVESYGQIVQLLLAYHSEFPLTNS